MPFHEANMMPCTANMKSLLFLIYISLAQIAVGFRMEQKVGAVGTGLPGRNVGAGIALLLR
jgi:hypothetical protein